MKVVLTSTIYHIFFLAGLFWRDFFFCGPRLNQENKGLWYHQNQCTRERLGEAKRAGEKEDTIKLKNENEISLFFDFENKIALTPDND